MSVLSVLSVLFVLSVLSMTTVSTTSVMTIRPWIPWWSWPWWPSWPWYALSRQSLWIGSWRLSHKMRAHCRVDRSKWWIVNYSLSYICRYRAAVAAKKFQFETCTPWYFRIYCDQVFLELIFPFHVYRRTLMVTGSEMNVTSMLTMMESFWKSTQKIVPAWVHLAMICSNLYVFFWKKDGT